MCWLSLLILDLLELLVTVYICLGLSVKRLYCATLPRLRWNVTASKLFYVYIQLVNDQSHVHDSKYH